MQTIFDNLKPGQRFTLFSDTVYMKIDTVKDNSGESIKTSGRWPYRDYNAININNGRLITLVDGAQVTVVS
jgi:hypothetical protein